ncbi:Alpha/Beta hydrolase protein, partial [Plectosphaerella cucumerina]
MMCMCSLTSVGAELTFCSYVFKNIPYAAPPTGDLRWAKPAPPIKKSGVQTGAYGPSCPQSIVRGINFVGPGNQSPVGAAVNQFLGGIPIPSFGDASEDCLYLDIYVPSKAIRNPSSRLAVAVFIYGGGYVMGSKDVYQPHLPFYDGSGLLTQANGDLVFVTFNYRLGAYGFLAGTTMERDGLPNAGLWDQRAALQWVQDNISKFGGDKSRVTAIGESAGAGSIIHHLVAKGGKLDPLFHRAVILSPAYQPMWDRAGTVEDTFKRFESLAGCAGKGLKCLRAASPKALASANDQLIGGHLPLGSFAVGPTPDGDFIRQPPVLELSTNNFWKPESLVISHCANEATLFVSGGITTNVHFSTFVNGIFPNDTQSNGLVARITNDMYPPVAAGSSSKFKTQAVRMEALLRDSSFTCNIRHLNAAMGDDRVYNMQYSVSPGWHGSDLFAVFYNARFSSGDWSQVLAALVFLPVGILYGGISWALQSYLTSYAITGDPNARKATWNLPPAIRWGRPDSTGKGDRVGGVLNVGNWFYSTIDDEQIPRRECDFWREFASAATLSGGYAPPGAGVVRQGLVDVGGRDVSARFRGGN